MESVLCLIICELIIAAFYLIGLIEHLRKRVAELELELQRRTRR